MRTYAPTALPLGFTPGDHHIIIGRGRTVKNHVANKKFDKMVSLIAKEYQAATCKAEKGNILSTLIREIHNWGGSAPDTAGFVKKDAVSGRWMAVEESLARTTAAQAIRNYLHGEYRSSKQFKQQRRLQQIRDGILPTSGNSSSSASLMKRCVSPESSSSDTEDNSVTQQQGPQEEPTDTFSILFSHFGGDSANKGHSDDPFSPTPIADRHNKAPVSKKMNLASSTTKLPAAASPAASNGPSLAAFDSHVLSLLAKMRTAV